VQPTLMDLRQVALEMLAGRLEVRVAAARLTTERSDTSCIGAADFLADDVAAGRLIRLPSERPLLPPEHQFAFDHTTLTVRAEVSKPSHRPAHAVAGPSIPQGERN
jgi:hypothetical protein